MEQKLENLEEVTDSISKNKKSIEKKLKEDGKLSKRLERKISKSRKKQL